MHPKAAGIAAYAIDRGNFLVTVQKSNGLVSECRFDPGSSVRYLSTGDMPNTPAPGTGLAGFYEGDVAHLYYQEDKPGGPIVERMVNTRDTRQTTYGRPTTSAPSAISAERG